MSSESADNDMPTLDATKGGGPAEQLVGPISEGSFGSKTAAELPQVALGQRRAPRGMTLVWGRNDLSGVQVSVIGPKRAAVPVAAEISRRNQKLARVQAPYSPKKASELPLQVGELLFIVDDRRKWWVARNATGMRGRVPSNYLKLTAGKLEIRGYSTPPPTPEPEPTPEVVLPWPPAGAACAWVIADYTANRDEEVSVKQGDEVVIVDDRKRWWVVRLQTGAQGKIPSNYLRLPAGSTSPVPMQVSAEMSQSPSPSTMVEGGELDIEGSEAADDITSVASTADAAAGSDVTEQPGGEEKRIEDCEGEEEDEEEEAADDVSKEQAELCLEEADAALRLAKEMEEIAAMRLMDENEALARAEADWQVASEAERLAKERLELVRSRSTSPQTSPGGSEDESNDAAAQIFAALGQIDEILQEGGLSVSEEEEDALPEVASSGSPRSGGSPRGGSPASGFRVPAKKPKWRQDMDDQIKAEREQRRQHKQLRKKLHNSAQRERAQRQEKAVLNRARSRDRNLIHKTLMEARNEISADELNFVIDESEYDFMTHVVGLGETMEMRLGSDDSMRTPSYLEPKIRRADSGQVARAITDYTKAALDELSVKVDELVIVLDDREESWFIRNATGLEGRAPRLVFELDGPSSMQGPADENAGVAEEEESDDSSSDDDDDSGAESEPEEQAAAEKLRLLAAKIGSFLEGDGTLKTAADNLSSTLDLDL